MPLVSPHHNNPLDDGRQSERALAVRRGARRVLTHRGFTCLAEMTLANGRRADLVALSRTADIWIVEIKSSVEDMRADSKWPDYRQFCDQLYFASLPDVPMDIFPQECGYLVSDGFQGEVLREAPVHKISAARRKAMLIRMAMAGAARLEAAENAGCELPPI